MQTAEKTTSKAQWDVNRKVTTDTGKPVSEFSMKVWFYDSTVDHDTGEVVQKQWTYRGWKAKRDLALIGQVYPTELDALLIILRDRWTKIQRAIIYDNKQSGFDQDTELPASQILYLFKGQEKIVTGVITKQPVKINYLKRYTIIIPRFVFKKHAA
jgi:hypothetical protein